MGPSIRDRASTLIERMSPRARQWATIGAISAVAVGVLWTVFAMGSGDSPQRSAVAAGAGDLKPTNVDLMAPGAQVREVEAWVGQAGKKLAQYESERDDQRRINRERKEAEDNLMRRFADLEARLKASPGEPAPAASAPNRCCPCRSEPPPAGCSARPVCAATSAAAAAADVASWHAAGHAIPGAALRNRRIRCTAAAGAGPGGDRPAKGERCRP